VGANLKITEITGRTWELDLVPEQVYLIGRAKDNQIVLNDQRVSRHHAHIRREGLDFKIVDGYYVGTEIHRSVNRVFVNGLPYFEKVLQNGDRITIGASKLDFTQTPEVEEEPEPITQSSTE
jgi:pSer/pThr/pTyr-binding forkhead associated (FHA) protein